MAVCDPRLACEETDELAQFLPSSTLITGHDIIFFWVARMIMMTLHFTGRIPFQTVYVHGLVRDAEGNKMSKTKGNGLDPLDFIDGIDLESLVTKRTSNLTQPQLAPRIEKATRKDFPDGIPAYGTDALRFTFCALATTGRDIKFDLQRIEGYRNFCNKLWNATRFVLMNTEDFDAGALCERSQIDEWMISKLHGLITDTQFALDTYRFDIYASKIYDFAWREYCDWYLELTKPLLWDEDAEPAQVQGTRRTLLEVLEALLRIAHPVMPFITETLWHQVTKRLHGEQATIMTQAFPTASDFPRNPAAEGQVEWLKSVISAVRNIRGEAQIKPSQPVPLLLQGGADEDRAFAGAVKPMLKRLANIEQIDWLADQAEAPPNALALVEDLRVMVPLAGLIDVAAEQARLKKELDKAEQELKRLQGKLSNEKFVANAPSEVVAKERVKAEEAQSRIAALKEQYAALDALA